MAYVDPDYKTKKAFKEAVKAGVQHRPYNPSGMFPLNGRDQDWSGHTTVEGPHYPKPHTWYAQVDVADGVVVKVK